MAHNNLDNDPELAILIDLRRRANLPNATPLIKAFNVEYISFVDNLLKLELSRRARKMKAHADYLTSLATVSAFLASVQIGFMALTSSDKTARQENNSHAWKAVNFFSFSSICYDVLGAVSALTYARSLLQKIDKCQEIIEAKQDIDAALQRYQHPNYSLGTEAEVLNPLLEQTGAANNTVRQYTHIFKDQVGGDFMIIMAIFGGAVFFFVSFLGFVIITQSTSVWLPTTLFVVATAALLVWNSVQNHPQRVKP